MTTPGRDRHEAALRQRVVDVELLVARIDPRRVRFDPHLHEMHVGVAAGVHLRVPDPGTGRHPLSEAGVEQAPIAFGVLVLELAVEHPGDDLHVLVRVGVEPGAGPHDIVVVDE